MVQSQLSAYSGSDPIWGFVALVGSELFTGEACVGLDPRVRLFAVEGHIYFAEREDDAAVATRLVNCGAVTAMQLARGSVKASGHESLARLFQRDATIDRDAVELTIATSTESLLASIAQNPVGMPEVFPLRYHPSGIHHWLRGPLPMIADEPVAESDEAVDEVAVAGILAADLPIDDIAAEIPSAVVPVLVDLPVLTEVPVLAEELPVVADLPDAPVVAEAPVVADLPIAADFPVVADLPVAADEALTLPALETYPAPTIPAAALTVPEWPRVDDEPAWAIPADLVEIPQIAAPVAADPVVAAVVPITAAHLPQLAPLHSIQIQPTSTDFFETASAAFEPPQPIEPTPSAIDDPLLPKLAAGPMSIKDLKRDLQMTPTLEPWSSTSNNMATVQIWEMVDDLFEDPKKENVRVGAGAPEARGHGWRRKKG